MLLTYACSLDGWLACHLLVGGVVNNCLVGYCYHATANYTCHQAALPQRATRPGMKAAPLVLRQQAEAQEAATAQQEAAKAQHEAGRAVLKLSFVCVFLGFNKFPSMSQSGPYMSCCCNEGREGLYSDYLALCVA